MDAPPPSPANPGMAGLVPQGAPPPGSPAPQQASPEKAIVSMGREIDMALTALASLGVGSDKFAEARRLIQAGVAELLQQAPGAETASSPTAAGSPFPGTTPSSPIPRS